MISPDLRGTDDQRPLSGAAFGEKAAVAAWYSKPTWGILSTADGSIDPGLRRFSDDRVNATVTGLDGASHVVMLSQPAVVAEVVRSAVHSLVEHRAAAGVSTPRKIASLPRIAVQARRQFERDDHAGIPVNRSIFTEARHLRT